MGVFCDGSSYGIEKDLVYSLPVKTERGGSYSIVQGLPVDDFAREKMDFTMKELIQERDDALQTVNEWHVDANLWNCFCSTRSQLEQKFDTEQTTPDWSCSEQSEFIPSNFRM